MPNPRSIPVLRALIALLAATSALQAATPRRGLDTSTLPEPLSRPVPFFRDVHPLLAEHCVSCHGAEKQKGGLRLDSREAALAGGSSYGPAILPGNSAESPLIQFMAHLEPDLEMPPEKDARPDAEIALLRAWIDQGARWPAPKSASADGGTGSTLGNQALFFDQAERHWAFQPIPSLPAEATDSLPARIDGLIRNGLTGKGLTPSPAADPRVLIRRLHFDLTGLPPSPETVAAFAAHPTPQAYAALVDDLLASPRFGERWARYWLDLARYADTRDWQAQQDLRYPYAWTYRDYVITAFRDDKPYDQFLREQIAADLLGLPEGSPALAALGFLTVGPRFRNSLPEILNDRIDVVTRGIMGMTASCARCHDHKYDPIRTDDFYALYGIFASTEDLGDLPEIRVDSATATPDPKARAAYEAALAQEKEALTGFVETLKQDAIADILAQPLVYLDALHQMEVAKTADVRKLITGKKMTETALTPLGKAWNDLKRIAKWPKHPVLGPLARVAGASPDRKAEFLERIIETGRVPGETGDIHPLVLGALRAARPTDEKALLAVYAGLIAEATAAPETDGHREILAAVRGPGGWLDFDPKTVESAYRLLGKGRADLGKLYTAIAEVEATHPGAPPRAMAVRDKDAPVQPVVFVRGDPANRGNPVDRRFFEVFDPSKTPFGEGSGRRELAERITGPDNPVTARVWANHVWRHLLGTGLVNTPGDFGLQAEPPSHGELLDLLAAALRDRDWSTKQLIRDIVLSETYRQSSAQRPDAASTDPENRGYWRANRRRLDFEAMRDAILATSGQLDLTEGGRPVDLSAEPFPTRRTIYGQIDRANLDPLFTTFDFPSPDASSPERPSTLVPQQALFALNDGFMIAQARALAAASETGSTSPAEAIDRLYRRVFLRPPTPEELDLATGYLQTATADRGRSLQGTWLYGFGPPDPALAPKDRFTRLAHFDAATKRYQGGRVFPHPDLGHVSLSATGGHPGNKPETAAIRRWIAPSDGEIAIEGELTLGRADRSDGVRATVLSNRGGLLAEWTSALEPVPTKLERHVVRQGEVLDFAVDCRETATADGYRWAPSIRYLTAPEETPAGTQTHWDAQVDFGPPPPPVLQPLQQVAHALLMTNEFLFID